MVGAEQALAMMLKAQPVENVPWKDTYPTTAAAFAKAANSNPLFQGEDGPAKTLSVLVSVATFESALRPDAKGDCDKKDRNGMCLPGARPHSFCAFQIHETNFATLGVTRDQLLTDIDLCTQSALRLMRQSFRLCRGKTDENLLNQYTTGGPVCVKPTKDEGAHRMRKAKWLFNKIKEEQ